MVFRCKPQLEDEVHDFIENFFEQLKSEEQGNKGALLAKDRVIQAIHDSTLSSGSKNQLLEHMRGQPLLVDLEQEAGEFL